MTADNVFKFYRAYKLFFRGSYNFKKYGGKLKAPPLLNQPERRFYHRIAQKLNDAQVHALFTTAFFYKPDAYVADMVSPEAFTRAVAFASRAENGRTLLEHELYDLKKRLDTIDLDTWLYGEPLGVYRSAIPECMQDVISGQLSLDLAAMLFLIPQPALQYHWKAFHSTSVAQLGVGPWIGSLEKVDTLIMLQRPGWRILSHGLMKDFWASFNVTTLAAKETDVETGLFEDGTSWQ